MKKQPLAIIENAVQPKPTRDEILTAMATIKRDAMTAEETERKAKIEALTKRIDSALAALVKAAPGTFATAVQTPFYVSQEMPEDPRVVFTVPADSIPKAALADLRARRELECKMICWFPSIKDIKRQLRAAMADKDTRVTALLADKDARAALCAAVENLDKAA